MLICKRCNNTFESVSGKTTHTCIYCGFINTETTKKNYEAIGQKIGKLVAEKNKAYGDAFNKSAEFLKILYPNGVKPEQYDDMLGLVRVFDKQMRIAHQKDAFGENPWNDIAGYGILKSEV